MNRFSLFALASLLLYGATVNLAWAVSEGTSCTGSQTGSSVIEDGAGGRHTRFVCDGTVYRELESWGDGGWQTVRLGKADGYSQLVAACTAQQEGILMYDKVTNKLLFCNGTFWNSVGLTLYIPIL